MNSNLEKPCVRCGAVCRERKTGRCKPCHIRWVATARKLNPETFSRRDAVRRRRNTIKVQQVRRKALYGLTVDAYLSMLREQAGLCAICRKKETAVLHGNIKNLAVDHCHATGRVRGLLCQKCNTALGSFDDNPELLQDALRYLSRVVA